MNENRDNDKFQEEKKQMKLKVNYVNQTNTFSNNEKQVKNILNDITETQNDQKLGKMVNEEIVRQNTSFQERLQKKKKDKMSKKINSMDYNNSLDSIHRKDISEYSGIRHREEEDSMHSTMNKLFPEESKEANGKELAKDKSMSKLKGKFNKKLEIIEENAQSDYQNTNTEFENNQEGFNNNTSEGLFNDNVSSGSGNIRDEDEEKDTISFKDIRKVTEKIDETVRILI